MNASPNDEIRFFSTRQRRTAHHAARFKCYIRFESSFVIVRFASLIRIHLYVAKTGLRRTGDPLMSFSVLLVRTRRYFISSRENIDIILCYANILNARVKIE